MSVRAIACRWSCCISLPIGIDEVGYAVVVISQEGGICRGTGIS